MRKTRDQNRPSFPTNFFNDCSYIGQGNFQLYVQKPRSLQIIDFSLVFNKLQFSTKISLR